MCGKLTNLLSVLLLLGLVGTVESHAGDAVAIWLFDDGAGDVAIDSTGNGYDGSLRNSPTWGDGVNGGGLWFSSAEANKVIAPVPHLNTLTITMWALYTDLPSTNIGLLHFQTGEDDNTDPASKIIGMWVENTSLLWGRIIPARAGNVNFPKNATVEANVWNHFAMVINAESGKATQYFNGEAVGEVDYPGELTAFTFANIGRQGGESWEGGIDEVAIFDGALSPDEIKAVMSGVGGEFPLASGPDPANGAMLEATWVNLGWRAGDYAVSHDVYLSDNFDDVNNGAEGAFQGNLGTTSLIAGFAGFAFPDGLVPGTTYYWRVDEVNDADPNSPWKGDVWSFSIPPKTAYSPVPADAAESVPLDVELSWTGGFGAKLHTAYIGTNFDDVNDAAGGVPLGSASYSPGTLESEKVYYWRVDEFDPPFTHKGDIWSFTTPGAVGNPQPANGAVDVQMIETLSWMAADNATSHELYFGTDADAVKNATTASPEYIGPRALGAESYDPGGLAWDSSYAWRVDEVYPTETIKGLVWSFTTADFIHVDDFESYNDIDPPDPNSNRIFDKWIDGFGTTTNGALVGNDL
ncbi:MAG: LamG domain-containing protein, partial [Planctomycetes bacterium]|nr:LamG domain-containing protein [Planctomycetota bacterium]